MEIEGGGALRQERYFKGKLSNIHIHHVLEDKRMWGNIGSAFSAGKQMQQSQETSRTGMQRPDSSPLALPLSSCFIQTVYPAALILLTS